MNPLCYPIHTFDHQMFLLSRPNLGTISIQHFYKDFKGGQTMPQKQQLNMNVSTTKALDYHDATGKIKHSLKNDMVFHMVMNKSEIALKGLVCAVKGF